MQSKYPPNIAHPSYRFTRPAAQACYTKCSPGTDATLHTFSWYTRPAAQTCILHAETIPIPRCTPFLSTQKDRRLWIFTVQPRYAVKRCKVSSQVRDWLLGTWDRLLRHAHSNLSSDNQSTPFDVMKETGSSGIDSSNIQNTAEVLIIQHLFFWSEDWQLRLKMQPRYL